MTLRLPVDALRRFRVFAAKRETSMSDLMLRAINEMVSNDDDSRERARRMVDHMRNAPPAKNRGKITWTREELYDERLSRWSNDKR